MDRIEFHIGEAARRLSVTPKHFRVLEREGRILPPRRDLNDRVYISFDIALLKRMGVGSRPRRLNPAEEVLRGTRRVMRRESWFVLAQSSHRKRPATLAPAPGLLSSLAGALTEKRAPKHPRRPEGEKDKEVSHVDHSSVEPSST